MSLETDLEFLRVATRAVGGEERAVEESWLNVERGVANVLAALANARQLRDHYRAELAAERRRAEAGQAAGFGPAEQEANG